MNWFLSSLTLISAEHSSPGETFGARRTLPPLLLPPPHPQACLRPSSESGAVAFFEGADTLRNAVRVTGFLCRKPPVPVKFCCRPPRRTMLGGHGPRVKHTCSLDKNDVQQNKTQNRGWTRSEDTAGQPKASIDDH